MFIYLYISLDNGLTEKGMKLLYDNLKDKPTRIRILDFTRNKINENGLNTFIELLGTGNMKNLESVTFSSI